MKKYSTLFIDLDDTLLDFKQTESQALQLLFSKYQIDIEKHLELYKSINHKLWEQVEHGTMTPNILKVERFKQFIDALSLDYDAVLMCEDFETFLGLGEFPLEGALELIEDLSKKYTLVCTTNGLSKVQRQRLINTKLNESFNHIVISEEVNSSKPQKEFFDFALNVSKANRNEVLVIGDSYVSDIEGANGSGIDSAWLNWKGLEGDSFVCTYNLSSLNQLREILL